MKKLILLILIAVIGWQTYGKYETRKLATAAIGNNQAAAPVQFKSAPSTLTNAFQCDGRTHCSQMRSCEEATFFLKNCPNTKMDGDHDGIPCETQWCR